MAIPKKFLQMIAKKLSWNFHVLIFVHFFYYNALKPLCNHFLSTIIFFAIFCNHVIIQLILRSPSFPSAGACENTNFIRERKNPYLYSNIVFFRYPGVDAGSGVGADRCRSYRPRRHVPRDAHQAPNTWRSGAPQRLHERTQSLQRVQRQQNITPSTRRALTPPWTDSISTTCATPTEYNAIHQARLNASMNGLNLYNVCNANRI